MTTLSDDELLLLDLNLLIKTDPDAELILARGITLRRLGRLDEALSDFETYLILGFDEGLKYRGECYLKKGELSRAAADLDRYIAGHPRDAFALRHYGEIFRLVEEWERAQVLFQRSLMVEPENAFAMSGLAECLRNLGQPSRAFSLYNKVLEHDPFHSQALAGRASLYKDRGETQLALEDYRVAVMEDPSNLFAQDGLRESHAIAEGQAKP